MSIILHIGASKCGSSAIQTALTWSPLEPANGNETYTYAAMHVNRGILYGPELRDFAASMPSNFLASPGVWQLSALGVDRQKHLLKELARIDDMYDNVILSSEAIYHQIAQPNRLDFLKRIEAPIRAILYVRPQVPLMNAAWWQWGAWTDHDLESFVSQQLSERKWSDYAEAWEASGLFESLDIRLVPSDVVSDFFDLLGLKVTKHAVSRANASLRGDVLRVLQRNRELRRTPHDCSIDFVLERLLGRGPKPPWVISCEMAKSIIDACRSSNQALLKMLDAEHAQKMKDDPAWWDADVFSDRILESPGVVPPEPLELDSLVAELVQVLFELDGRARSK